MEEGTDVWCVKDCILLGCCEAVVELSVPLLNPLSKLVDGPLSYGYSWLGRGSLYGQGLDKNLLF